MSVKMVERHLVILAVIILIILVVVALVGLKAVQIQPVVLAVAAAVDIRLAATPLAV
jgi:hypothetical protein